MEALRKAVGNKDVEEFGVARPLRGFSSVSTRNLSKRPHYSHRDYATACTMRPATRIVIGFGLVEFTFIFLSPRGFNCADKLRLSRNSKARNGLAGA
jgi:hypothetical protein